LGVAAIAEGVPRIRHPHHVYLTDFLSTLNKSDDLTYILHLEFLTRYSEVSLRDLEETQKGQLRGLNATHQFAAKNQHDLAVPQLYCQKSMREILTFFSCIKYLTCAVCATRQAAIAPGQHLQNHLFFS